MNLTLPRIPPQLRRPLTVASLTLVGGAALLTAVLHAHNAARAEHQALNRRLEQLGHDYQALLARQADARQAIAEWADLRGAGLVVDAPASHLPALRTAAQHATLRIAPTAPQDNPDSPFVLVGISAQGRLAHEGHLLNLLDELGALKLGLFVPLACRVERTADDGLPIDTDCRFAWVALRRDI